MTASFALSLFDVIVFLVVVVPFAVLVRHRGAIPRLPVSPPGTGLPRLSVVVPARDEAASVGSAIRSLLEQDYPDLELIVVDDRSRDGTGGVIRDLAARDARLVPIRVDELPAGWLGKNHALWRGSERATGD